MAFRIFIVLLFSNYLLYSNQEVILKEKSFYLKHEKLVLCSDNSCLQFSEYVNLFKSYRKSFLDGDYEDLIKLFRSNDVLLKGMQISEVRSRWLAWADSIKDMQIIAFIVDQTSNNPSKIIFASKNIDNKNEILSVAVYKENSILKIGSSEFNKDSELTKLKESWNTSYPEQPIILDNLYDKIIFKIAKFKLLIFIILTVTVAIFVFRLLNTIRKGICSEQT